ncbi:MAG: NAD(P)/FAD-dependent oxidoreductase [Caldilineaceae bacterium]
MQEEIIVIGAGMAGLAAATTLQAAGKNVRILEGRNRIGGRTHTDSTLGTSVDLGAAWIHGPIGNPLTPLAHRFDVQMGETYFNDESGTSAQVFNAQGQRLDAKEYVQGMLAYEAAMEQVAASVLHKPRLEARSLADLYADGLPGEAELTPTQRAGFNYSAQMRAQFVDAADVGENDWRLSREYMHLPGGDLYLYGGGYKRIVDGLAADLNIELETAVTQIEYGAGGVRVTTIRDAFTCDKVIVTAPLGVLKANKIQFAPALPAEKQHAIARLGMGNYDKVVLKFPHRFWPQEPQRFQYLNDSGIGSAWLNIAHYKDAPVLINYHAGSRAQFVNRLSDAEYLGRALDALRVMFKCDVPAPVAIVRTNWESDPFALGSYSFQKVGCELEDRQRLATPIDNRLFFAGEATHPHYFATVHGAYETGVRAAREVIG